MLESLLVFRHTAPSAPGMSLSVCSTSFDQTDLLVPDLARIDAGYPREQVGAVLPPNFQRGARADPSSNSRNRLG